MTCPHRTNCSVLSEVRSTLALEGWEAAYCDRGGATCERLRLGAAGADVPDDLLPDGRVLVTMGELEECAP